MTTMTATAISTMAACLSQRLVWPGPRPPMGLLRQPGMPAQSCPLCPLTAASKTAHGAICAGPLAVAMMPPHTLVGVSSWQPGMLACALGQALSPQASGVCSPPQPLLCPAMPRALQSWLPQPHLRVRGQASCSLGGERCSICSWQCFPDCGHNRDNNNAGTTANAITMT